MNSQSLKKWELNMRLVLVYLGEEVPDYVWSNIKHLLSIQELHDVNLILSNDNQNKVIKNPRLEYLYYEAPHEINELFSKLEIDGEFRSGFWRFSLERLIALAMHHEKLPNEDMLHIESDVLLLPNFPFTQFRSLDKISWTRVDAKRDVATLIYIPSYSDSSQFKRDILREIGRTGTPDDMTVLRLIAEGDLNSYGLLPTIPKADSNLVDKSIGISNQVRELMSDGSRIFGGIFDAAGIGIWLTGTDPRNYFGVTRRYLTKIDASATDYIRPDLVNFEIDNFGGISVIDDGISTQIFNLHIHSKNPHYFDQKYINQLVQDVRRSKYGRTFNSFSLKTLVQLVMQNLRKGTLIRFLMWLPFVQKVRKWLVPVHAKD
jgi:hypothetical protein